MQRRLWPARRPSLIAFAFRASSARTRTAPNALPGAPPVPSPLRWIILLAHRTRRSCRSPDGTTCGDKSGTTLLTLSAKRGFWRPSSTSSDAKACPHRTCAGGEGAPSRYDVASTATCEPGRGVGGIFCTQCVDGPTFYFDDGASRCRSCDAAPRQFILGLVFGVIGAICACILLRRWLREHWPDVWRRMAAACTGAWRRIKSATGGIKIVWSFFQIIAVLGEVYVLSYPPAYASILNILQAVTFKITVRSYSPPLHPLRAC